LKSSLLPETQGLAAFLCTQDWVISVTPFALQIR
jgi:hypothetical protein